jgi:hypothetical protein
MAQKIRTVQYESFQWHTGEINSCFFSCLTDRRRPEPLVSYIILYKGYCHCDRLCSSRHRLLNLPDTQRTMQRWQSVGRSVGQALIGQAETPCLSYGD